MIACLGWGSLVWRPDDLPIDGPWLSDGPIVKVEYVRQSNGNRMTLVLHEGGSAVPSLWVGMKNKSLDEAMKALARREGTGTSTQPTRGIGSWHHGQSVPSEIVGLEAWATTHDVDHVVWTALGPKFRGQNGVVPSREEVVEFLKTLSGKERASAEEYVRRTPAQIATSYRHFIEEQLALNPRR